jgi:hypothetical protein
MVTSPFFLHYPYPPPSLRIYIPFCIFISSSSSSLWTSKESLAKENVKSLCVSQQHRLDVPLLLFSSSLPSRSLVYFHIINTHKARAFHSIKSHISPFFVYTLLSLSLDRDVVCV